MLKWTIPSFSESFSALNRDRDVYRADPRMLTFEYDKLFRRYLFTIIPTFKLHLECCISRPALANERIHLTDL